MNTSPVGVALAPAFDGVDAGALGDADRDGDGDGDVAGGLADRSGKASRHAADRTGSRMMTATSARTFANVRRR
jgi:hypothetical protein